MMRSLWSAASGMIAQQTNMDVISNNIANVNDYARQAPPPGRMPSIPRASRLAWAPG